MRNDNSNGSESISDFDCYAEEQGWIEGIRIGDKKAFRTMFEAYYDSLLRFAFRYVHSETIAEGLVQNVFLWIWNKREEWEVEGKLKTYLFRAVKYEAIDHLRHKRTEEQYIEKFSELRNPYVDPQISYKSEESEFISAARQAIEELPERARVVYKLSRLEGLTYKEIAEVLEISPKTVESHMSRALGFLRERLSKYLPAILVLDMISEII